MHVNIYQATRLVGEGYIGGATEVEIVDNKGKVLGSRRLKVVGGNTSETTLILLNEALRMIVPQSVTHVEFYSLDKNNSYIVNTVCRANRWAKEGYRKEDGELRANIELISEYIETRETLGADADGNPCRINILVENYNNTGERLQSILRVRDKLMTIAKNVAKEAMINNIQISGEDALYPTAQEA